VTTSLLIAPFTPFAAEEIYQVLVRGGLSDAASESVHLCEYPAVDEFPADERLSRSMALAREASALGRAARADAKVKVRTPLSEAIVVAPDAEDSELLSDLVHIVSDELNVKKVWVARRDPKQVTFSIKPNFKTLGPRLGKKVKDLAKVLAQADGAELRRALAAGRPIVVCEDAECGELYLPTENRPADGATVHELTGDDLDLRASAVPGYAAASGIKLVVILNTEITKELRQEGIARDFVSSVQAKRKEENLAYEARISIHATAPSEVVQAVQANEEYVRNETLAHSISFVDALPDGAGGASAVSCYTIEDGEVRVRVETIA
jgi:isoleucyl-tRNA synthetase